MPSYASVSRKFIFFWRPLWYHGCFRLDQKQKYKALPTFFPRANDNQKLSSFEMRAVAKACYFTSDSPYLCNRYCV